MKEEALKEEALKEEALKEEALKEEETSFPIIPNIMVVAFVGLW